MYTEHIHKIFMCVFHLTMTMMITIIINATIYYCIHHLHVAIRADIATHVVTDVVG